MSTAKAILILLIVATTTYGQTYDTVKCAIQTLLAQNNYADGPLIVRLAWHSSGTYSKVDGSGGCNGARIRFAPEATDLSNAGLMRATRLLEPIKRQFTFLSYADLYTLAGATAIEAMGGPYIAWRSGRSDAVNGNTSPPNGRLPDAALDATHVRTVFTRLSFSDAEAVALNGAHVLGRAHAQVSNYTGPWTRNPLMFSNAFFTTLIAGQWAQVNRAGKVQFNDRNGQGPHMMLPTDMVMMTDPTFNVYVRQFAASQAQFYTTFSSAFSRLFELGVPPLTSSYVNLLNCGLATTGVSGAPVPPTGTAPPTPAPPPATRPTGSVLS